LFFFGIDRRLDVTGPMIEELVSGPAQSRFLVANFGFMWAPKLIANSRSGENSPLISPRLDRLPEGQYPIVWNF
jgi:hypothetical protein